VSYRISGEGRRGSLAKERETARAALAEAQDLEKRGYTRVRIRDPRGKTHDLKAFGELVASGRIAADG
jgi:hypothetical protein